MQQIKIAFFDIDGTLVKLHAGEMTPPTRQALAALRQNGVRVCLATGRSPLTLPPFPGVAFDAYLTFNGSYCYDAQQVLFSNPIPQADVRRLVENAAAIGRSALRRKTAWPPTGRTPTWRIISASPGARWKWPMISTACCNSRSTS